jgi:hypothetical protein
VFALVRTVLAFSVGAGDRQVIRERSAFGRNSLSIGGTPRSSLASQIPRCQGDRRLFNQYGIMLVNPVRHPNAKADLGNSFVE